MVVHEKSDAELWCAKALRSGAWKHRLSIAHVYYFVIAVSSTLVTARPFFSSVMFVPSILKIIDFRGHDNLGKIHRPFSRISTPSTIFHVSLNFSFRPFQLGRSTISAVDLRATVTLSLRSSVMLHCFPATIAANTIA